MVCGIPMFTGLFVCHVLAKFKIKVFVIFQIIYFDDFNGNFILDVATDSARTVWSKVGRIGKSQQLLDECFKSIHNISKNLGKKIKKGN